VPPVALRASTVLSFLKSQAVTHLVGLPDNASAALFSAVATDPVVRLVNVSREGEAFALAAGLWVGGAKPVVVMQNTGFLESGDALRGTAVRMSIPLVFFVTYRGYATLPDHIDPTNLPTGHDLLIQPDIDSSAVVTEPTLRAWGVPYHQVRSDDDIGHLRTAFATATQGARPTAVLVTGSMT